MNVYCIESFESDISGLQKNNSYKDVLSDVCDYFSDKNIEELHITRDIIHNAKGSYSLNKFRITNSTMKKGKSGSYRCISVVLPKQDNVFLGCIYPKTGSEGFDNLPKERYKEIAAKVAEAIASKRYKMVHILDKKIMAVPPVPGKK